ncbi:MAG TPA: TrbG/VirB9 family P-type conjugative transfer protein [Candidatus Saccharimonadia bacterium]|nr:TrbG/VirB9 family P-type conjugative transfer protein [Candidatus Saccharimonadia bacterium]
MVRSLTLVVCLLAGCAAQRPVLPDVPTIPDDLSTWGVPAMVQAPRPPIMPTLAVSVKETPPLPTEKVYAYEKGGAYLAPVSVGFPLDIVFARGEQVHNVTDGDRAPQVEGQARHWEVRQGKEGLGAEERHHIFVTVTDPGLRNGLTVTTTQRTFYITLESVAKSPVRVLRWKEDLRPADGPPVAQAATGPLPPVESQYHVGYAIESEGSPPDWMPLGAWDDGHKLYVLLPLASLYGTSPLVRKIGPNGPAVVNGRQYLNVLIVDELAARLELRAGTGATAEVVRITRGNLHMLTCPASPGCPAFPQTPPTHHLPREQQS